MKKIILIGMLLLTSVCYAAPQEIIIVRHADKWAQKNPGPFLSPRGQVRAEKFALYYMATFPKPDFIFAAKPSNSMHPSESRSLRPWQTVAPLANMLAKDNAAGYRVHTPFFEDHFYKLAYDLLHNKKYDDKIILICWQHERINALVQALGVKQTLKAWEGHNYDMVYVLKFAADGKLASFQILQHQYPVKGLNPTWKDLSCYGL